MYARFEYLVGTDVLDLNGRYIVKEYEDFGLATVEFPTDESPDQHGVTEYDEWYMKPRLIKLVETALSQSRAEYDADRKNLLRILGPRKQRGTLRLTKDDGQVYQIDCRLIDGLKGNTTDRQGFVQNDVLVFHAPWPCWYDPDRVSVRFSLGVGGDSHDIPLDIPMGFGASALGQTLTVTYEGTFMAYPIITLAGPITGATITNITTGDKITFKPTSTIGAGQTYTIDTRSSYLQVRDQNNVVRTSELDETQTDLVSFHIASIREEAAGVNTLRVEGTGANTQTDVTIAFYTQYDGI